MIMNDKETGPPSEIHDFTHILCGETEGHRLLGLALCNMLFLRQCTNCAMHYVYENLLGVYLPESDSFHSVN